MAGGVFRSGASFLSSALIAAALATPADAQTSTVLANFEIKPTHPAGALVPVQDGIFYGVSSEGGRFDKGSVFVLYRAADGSWDTYTLHSFSGADGARPMQGLLLAQDDNFYGTTTEGGSRGGGTVFRITPFGELTTLRAFPIVNGIAQRPAAPLTQSADGYIWGTTCPGTLGTSETSSVFRMTTTAAFTTIYRSPLNSVCLSSLAHADNGQLIGLARREILGGSIVHVFRLTRAGQLTEITSIVGAEPKHLFRGSGGVFYALTDNGVSPSGIPANSGRVLGLTIDGAIVLDVAVSTGRTETLVEASPGLLYGTSKFYHGGADTFFRIQSDGSFSIIKQWAWEEDLTGTIGAPRVSLVHSLDGMFYGLSSGLGPSGAGTAFTIDLTGNTTALSTFSSGPVFPAGTLVESGGALYGASCAGGAFGQGTLFRVAGGTVTTLFSFGGGLSCPMNLLKGPDGLFYGHTLRGDIFKATPAGDLTLLYPAVRGWGTFNGLTLDASGNLWGSGQDIESPFVFRMTPSGDFTRLNLPSDAGNAGPGVAPASGGTLFGAVNVAPLTSAAHSQLFRMTAGGEFTPQFAFPSLQITVAKPTAGSDGNVYGSVVDYSRAQGASLFRATADGDVSILHTLTADQGWNVIAPLVELPNGDLAGVTFGTLNSRARPDFGTVFAVSKAGTFRTLHQFSWTDGTNPFATMIVGSDGALYGTTIAGGSRGGGVIFRIQP